MQGDRTVGIWEAPSESFLEKLEQGLGFEMPKHHGHDVVHAIKAMRKGSNRRLFLFRWQFHLR